MSDPVADLHAEMTADAHRFMEHWGGADDEFLAFFLQRCERRWRAASPQVRDQVMAILEQDSLKFRARKAQ